MRVFGGMRSRLAEKRDIEKPEHVESRQAGNARAEREEQIIVLFQCLAEDGILRVKSAERRDTAQGQRADQECQKRHGHFLSEVAHFPDVLLVMQRVDDRTRSEEHTSELQS